MWVGKTAKQKVLFLEYATILYNMVEGAVSIAASLATGSVALFAYGLESGIEVFSSVVAVWYLKGDGETRRKGSLKMLGSALILFALYVLFTVVESMINNERSAPTIVAIGAMAVIASGMLILGLWKQKLGKEMDNKVVLAEARLTLLDAALSASLCFSLILNLYLGWWWTDPLFALFIAWNSFRQGYQSLT
jgi:divalent metal cation (Fe/Co/Zn/Cd) transporter